MLQLKNNTPFSAAFALLPNEQGIDTLYIMLNAAFNISPQWTLVDVQPEPQQGDKYWGEPESSSLRLANDYHIGKSATDIMMSGYACSFKEQPVRQLDVHLSVGSINKTVRVFGDRCWQSGALTQPQPFTKMPLVYERAFGGVDIHEQQVRSCEERNPVGVGYAGKKTARDMEGTPLPNIECPYELIRNVDDRPSPAGFAPIAPAWLPRRQFAGTYDEQWTQTRAPYLPDDFQLKFLNAAHPALIYPGFLQGGEPVIIRGMHPSGDLNFNLPNVNLRNKITVDNNEYSAPFLLETLAIDPNKLQLTMGWRAAFPCDKKALKISSIQISLAR
jgi:hypothetical protein